MSAQPTTALLTTGGLLLVVLVQVTVMVALAPVVAGLTRQTRARIEGRAGAGVLQPWRDVRKLLAKRPIRARGTSWVTLAGPVALLVSGLLVAALVPLVAALPLHLVPDDLFVVVSVLLLGTVALALLGLDAGSAFGGMGSSRHMMIAALVEPTVLVAVYALSLPVGSSTLSLIVMARRDDPASIASPAGVLAVVALVVVVLAETGRLPVDNPATHLELTMVHEAMILEYSGRHLAVIEAAASLQLLLYLSLILCLFAPWGVAVAGEDIMSYTIALAVYVAKLAIGGLLLAVFETAVAKMRVFRVSDFLGIALMLGLLAVLLLFVSRGGG